MKNSIASVSAKSAIRFLSGAIALTAISMTPLSANLISWTGNGEYFSEYEGWSENYIPEITDWAMNDTGVTVKINDNWAVGAISSASTSNAVAFEQNSGDLVISAYEGNTGTEEEPVLTQLGGILAVGSMPDFLNNPGANINAQYSMSGGSITVNGTGNYLGYIYVGVRGGNGSFVQTGGAVNANNLYIGEGVPRWWQNVKYEDAGIINVAAASGSYKITSGTLNIGDRLTIGRFGHGTFIQEGGDLTIGSLQLADNVGKNDTGEVIEASGSYTMSGGTLTIKNASSIGWRGDATFTQTAGTITSQGSQLWVGDNYLNIDNVLYRAETIYNMSGGSISGNFGMGRWGGKGTFNLSGTGSVTAPTWLDVGSMGEGYFNQNGGTVTATGLAIGAGFQKYQKDGVEPRGYGEYNLNSGNLVITGKQTMYVGRDGGIGLYNQYVGDVVCSADYVTLGNGDNNAGKGELNIYGGTFTANGILEGGRNKQGEGVKSNEIRVMNGAILNANRSVLLAMDGGNVIVTVGKGSTINVGEEMKIGHNRTGKAEFNSAGVINILRNDGAGVAAARISVEDATATLTQTAGEFNSLNSDVIIRATLNTAGSGKWNVGAAATANVRRIVIGEYGNDTLRDAPDETTGGATLSIAGVFTTNEIASAQNSNSYLTFNGGMLKASANAVENGTGNFVSANIKKFNITGNGGVIDSNGRNIRVAPAINGTGNLVKNGTGTLTFGGDLTNWTGALNVAEGSATIAENSTLKFVLDGNNAVANGTVNAKNAYIGGNKISVGNNVTLTAQLENIEGLPNGTYTFNVLAGANGTGNVALAETEIDGISLSYENGKITLTVGEGGEPPESGFANWATEEFTSDELADSAISGPEADPQNIGVPNLLRYALGLKRDESPVGALPTLTKNDTAGGFGALSDGNSYTFSFRCDTTKEDISYIVETSTDLKNWAPVDTEPTIDANNGTASVTISADGAVRKFFRLKIVQK